MKDVFKKIGKAEYFLVLGDLTSFEGDAIVNAANSSLMGGGGVDGAIHRRGGDQILQECLKIRESYGQCDPGEAVITSGGKLKAKYVIHTVGPLWKGGGRDEEKTLKSCYRSCFAMARDYDITTLAFPSISTGAYHYPVEAAAKVSQTVVFEELKESPLITKVGFVLFEERTFSAYESAFRALSRP